MKKISFISCWLSVFLIFNIFLNSANAFSTPARSAYLIDIQSGAEIISKEAHTLMPPSSMLKLMTLVVAFDEIQDGNLKLDERIIVSDAADYQNPIWRDASKICLVKGQKISVNDAIMGLIVMSAGDAGVALAEKIAGSEDGMVQKMTEKAREIGMEKSSFGNVSGLPHPNNLMTSHELAILAKYIIENYPDMYPLFATKRFEFNEYQSEWCAQWGKTKTLNYNKLLFIMPSADGLKTGHTADGGYGMVASAKIGDRRLIGIINGFKGKGHEALAAEMKRLMNYGFNKTMNKVFYKPDDKIIEIPVWYGRKKTVIATVKKTLAITLPRGSDTKELRVLARYQEPIPAPIRKGDKIGEIIIQKNGQIVTRAPLVAAERVGKIQFLARIIKNISVIINGK